MFEKTIHAAIMISASPEAVWRTLIDFDSYPSWNPMIVSCRGNAAEGAQVRFKVRTEDGATLPLSAKVLTATPHEELSWRGGVAGVISGKHYFRIEAKPEGCLFHHGETFSGALIPLISGLLETKGAPLYRAMCEALKKRVEADRPT